MRNLALTWTFLFILHLSKEDTSVQKLSAPEKHFLVLMCSDASYVDWSHGLERVIASRRGKQVSYLDQSKHQLLEDGQLSIKDLQESDAGQYYCNHQLVADITVLKGHNFTVPVGTTVYLPCKTSDKLKQRWAFKRTPRSRKDFISTLYKNNTVKKERADPTLRFTHTTDHLIISSIQLQDSGLYLCNNREMAVLTVTTESAETESSSADINKYLTAAVLLALCMLAMLCVGLLSVTIGWKSRRRNFRKETEPTGIASGLQLQRMSNEGPWTPDTHEDAGEIQYASLAEHHWTQTDRQRSSRQQVIYSTLITS
ncbi:uncharacterized protein LOC122340559 isoform X2 [Puntigrus tetrazona]|uniref:uncharacterized protein LOC122340559 isoform X2 n=1 Tax=Puntigrus tetrazona TaxID=1606681 RepID=UPI001C88F508|nr:uncharacterized protein LOC122340559 isoform X2 [Puntigrus tetrazona]